MKKLSIKNKIAFYGICIIVAGSIIDFILFPLIFRFLGSVPGVENADILVVQGWIFDTMIDQTVEEINRGNYRAIVISGQRSSTAWTKERLVKKGVDESIVFEAPYSKGTRKDHTFNEAIYVKKTLDSRYPEVCSLNIATGAPHIKKSVTIFRRILGKKVRVGAFPCKPDHYDSDHIWKSRHGIYNTIRFFIGYLYALVWPLHWVDGYLDN